MFQNPINTQQSDRSLPLILQSGFPGYNDLLKLAPCGIGLMCGKRQANVTDWLESITVAVSTDFVTDLVRWGGVDATMPEEAAERASFMNLLARHPDARLRAAAAGDWPATLLTTSRTIFHSTPRQSLVLLLTRLWHLPAKTVSSLKTQWTRWSMPRFRPNATASSSAVIDRVPLKNWSASIQSKKRFKRFWKKRVV